MAYRIVLAPRALQDLEEIVRYISLDDADIAERFGRLLLEKVRQAGSYPWSGRVVPELQDPKIREFVVKSYRIVYRVEESKAEIQVARFWHASRGTIDLTSNP